MTTQARELAGIISNAGDLNFSDDITLGSDGAVLNFGADSEVTITHVHNTGLILNSTKQLQFGDSGTYINQSADGVLNITSDTEVEINATTVDINANVDVSGNIVLAGTITVGDADDDNMVINANVNSHIIPNTDDTFDLGSSGQQWRNVYVDGTLEADAITIGGVTLSETIADTVGAMTTSNTESGITVAYDDADNTLDFTVATLNQDTTGTAALFTASANNSTDETVYPVFVDGATGSQGAETDTGLTYNPSTGMLTSTGVTATFTGNITGNVTGNTSGTAATVTTAAQPAITSLGTLTTLTVDNVIVNGTTIGHTSDTDLMTLADGVLTVAGELDAASLDISGNVDIDGVLETDNLTVGGAQGSDGQVLTSTGSGVAWEDASGGAVSAINNATANELVTIGSTTTELDAEANLTFDGSTLALAGNATITTADNTATLTLISTDADADVGPILKLKRDSGSPADNDYMGVLRFVGDNDANPAEETITGNMVNVLIDASNGTEDSQLYLETMLAGGLASRWNASPTEFVINDDSKDLDFRVESDTYDDMLFVDGGNNRVGIGTKTPNTWLEIDDNGTTGTGGIGTPQVRIGSMNNTNVYAQIGFGWGGNSTYSPITLGMKGTSGSSYTKGDFVLNTRDATTDSAPTEKFRITSAGRVGIGTESPASVVGFGSGGVLHLKGDSGNDVSLLLEGQSGSGTRVELGASGGTLQVHTGTGSGSLTEKLRIFPDGQLGVSAINFGAAGTPRLDSSSINQTNSGADLKYNADGGHTFKTYDGGWVDKMAIEDVGVTHKLSNAGAGQVHVLYSGGYVTMADDATITLSGVANTGCLISIGSYRKSGQNVAYAHGLIFLGYNIGTAGGTIISDVTGFLRNSDTDGYICVYKTAGTGSVTVKNRLGISNNVCITVHRYLGL